MISASIGAMTTLLEETKKVPVSSGRTSFHRGKWEDPLRRDPDAYDETSVEELLTISKKFKVPFDDLMAANHIDDPHKLQIGQKLIIPTKPTKPKKTDK